MKKQRSQTPKLSELIDLETFIVSDTHFGHQNILKFEPTRLEDMQRKGFTDQDDWLVSQWNSVVAENDLVLHLGDFAFRNKEVIYRLNGRMVMLLGNHDVKSIEWFRNYQKRCPEKFELIEGIGDLSEPLGVSGLIREIASKKIFFSHYPLVTCDAYMRGKAKEARDAMAVLFEQEQCELCIHGHVHSNDEFTDKTKEINVSLERMGFAPVRLKQILP